MIKSFKCRHTEALFHRQPTKRFGSDIVGAARRKLLILNAASTLDDLRTPPGNRLEELKGDRKGQHSIRINDRLRICFSWNTGVVTGVEIVDYH